MKVQHALIFIDLNRFKQVNDTLGHIIGDALLVEVANRLKNLVSEKDIIARHGGDEFIITLVNISHPRDAAHFAEKIIRKIEEPFLLMVMKSICQRALALAFTPLTAKRQTSSSIVQIKQCIMQSKKVRIISPFILMN